MAWYLSKKVDDAIVCGCHFECRDLWGDELDVVISGLSLCAGCYGSPEIGPVPPTPFDYDLLFPDDPNGSFTAEWDDATETWRAVVGTVSRNVYNSSNLTCSFGVIETGVVNLIVSVSCESNLIGVSVGTDGKICSGPFFEAQGLAFSNPGSFSLDDAISNTLICGPVSASQIVVGFTGVITVSLP